MPKQADSLKLVKTLSDILTRDEDPVEYPDGDPYWVRKFFLQYFVNPIAYLDCSQINPQVVAFHLKELFSVETFFGISILDLLSITGNLSLFQHFVEDYNFDFVEKNKFEQTPLQFLMFCCQIEIEELKEKFSDKNVFQHAIENKIKNNDLLIIKNYEIFDYLLKKVPKENVDDIINDQFSNCDLSFLIIYYSFAVCPFLEKNSDPYLKIMNLVERIYRLDIEQDDVIDEQTFYWGSSFDEFALFFQHDPNFEKACTSGVVADLIKRFTNHTNEVEKICLERKGLKLILENRMGISTFNNNNNNNNNNSPTVGLLNFTEDQESNSMESEEESISDEDSQGDSMEKENEEDVKDSKKEVEEGNSSAKSTKDSKGSKQSLFWNKGELAPQDSNQPVPAPLHACMDTDNKETEQEISTSMDLDDVQSTNTFNPGF